MLILKSKIIASVLIVLFMSSQVFIPLFSSEVFTVVKVSKAESRNAPDNTLMVLSDPEDEAGDNIGLSNANLFCTSLFITETKPVCLSIVKCTNEQNYPEKISSCKLHIRNCVYRI